MLTKHQITELSYQYTTIVLISTSSKGFDIRVGYYTVSEYRDEPSYCAVAIWHRSSIAGALKHAQSVIQYLRDSNLSYAFAENVPITIEVQLDLPTFESILEAHV